MMMRTQLKRIRSSKGYSLVETMVIVMIFAFLLGAIFMILNMSRISWGTESVMTELNQELRKGMERMMLDLPSAGISKVSGVPVDGNPYSTITFEKATGVDASGNVTWSNSIQYLLSGTTPNRLLKRFNGTDTVLANDIQSVEFRRYNGSARILEVTLNASKRSATGHVVNSDLTFDVKIRN